MATLWLSASLAAATPQDVKHLSPSVGPTAHTPAHHSGFTVWRQGDDTIRLFDGATVSDIDVNSNGVGEPHTHAGVVVWEGQVPGAGGTLTSQIFAYDVITGGTPVQITSTSYDNHLPRVWRTTPTVGAGGYYIAWRGEASPGDADVFFYSSSSGTTTQLLRTGDDVPGFADGTRNHLDIEDDLICWQGVNATDTDVFVADVTGNKVTFGATQDISSPVDIVATANDSEPQTSAGYVVWRHNDGVTSMNDTIFSWDSWQSPAARYALQSETGAGLLLRPMIARDPNISGSPPIGQVVWTSQGNATDR